MVNDNHEVICDICGKELGFSGESIRPNTYRILGGPVFRYAFHLCDECKKDVCFIMKEQINVNRMKDYLTGKTDTLEPK